MTEELCIRCGKEKATRCTPEGICEKCWQEEFVLRACWEKKRDERLLSPTPATQSVCCKRPLEADQRFCPMCGWECQIEATPAREWVTVRREDLKTFLDKWIKDDPEYTEVFEIYDRLKAALGTREE